jgi:hypothetical protein
MLQITDHPLYKKHDIDSAMNSFWAFYKSRFLVLFLISFAMSLITQYGASLLNTKDLQNIADVNKTLDMSALYEKVKGFIVPLLILSVVSLFFSNILHYYILMKPLDSSKNILVSVVGSLKFFIPYIIILVILAFFGSFAIIAGLMVFIVGVIFSIVYLMMISFFILPIMMTEGINIGNVIVRTAKLSHRNFWSNIGWTSVFIILFLVINLVITSLIMLPFAGTFLKTLFNPGEAGSALNVVYNPIYIFLSAAGNALILPLIPIFGFLLYFNGRAREEVVKTPSYGDEDYKVRVEDLYAKPVHEEKKEEGETGRLGEGEK